MITDEIYQKATIEIEKIHSSDPIQETLNGKQYPAEVLYCKRILNILDLVDPHSSYAMKLAVQCQHLQRWGVPRSEYTYDRRGYHQWRRKVMEYQLQQTQTVLSRAGVDGEDIRWIMTAIEKQGDKSNPEAQIITDTACLVFLKWYMEPFAVKHESEKVIDIMKKTLRKMSVAGVNLVSKLDLPASSLKVLEQAGHIQ
jgi:hypothetical protein